MTTRSDLTGRVYNRLAVEAFAGVHNGKRYMWNCRCQCGNTVTVNRDDLQSGNTKSCGCLNTEMRSKLTLSHGHARRKKQSRLYICWCSMIERCTNPHQKNFAVYSPRGFDPRWRVFENFRDDIINHIGDHPGKGFSIHRIDNNAGYWLFHPITGELQVKWATSSEQNRAKGKRLGTSVYMGVHRRENAKWGVLITALDGEKKRLGSFSDEIEAALTRDIYVVKFRTGGILNFPKLLPKFEQYIACEIALAAL